MSLATSPSAVLGTGAAGVLALSHRPAPMQLVVAWHAGFAEGETLASELYTTFARDPSLPEVRGIGLPVFFRRLGPEFDASKYLVPRGFERTVIAVLVDDELVADDASDAILGRLRAESAALPSSRLIPVALTEHVGNLPSIAGLQHIRLNDSSRGERYRLLSVELGHALVRELRGGVRHDLQPSPPPIRVFLSHAKRDGSKLAEEVRAVLQKKTSLADFFDVHDIAAGYRFADELEGGIRGSALLVFQTDAYGSREWCQREVLWAKLNRTPILAVNAVQDREFRTFPYLGNVPSIRWTGRPEAPLIVAAALTLEILRAAFFEAHGWSDRVTTDDPLEIVSRPPELLTLLPDRPRVVLYPDPPLAGAELELLARHAPSTRFVTPTTRRRSQRGTGPLTGRRIGLSLSESQDLTDLGLSALHLRDAAIELCRHLLAAGATLVYGGDFRANGYTDQLFDLVRDHGRAGVLPAERIESFVAWPQSKQVDKELRATRKLDARFTLVELPDELREGEGTWSAEEQSWRRALVLSLMRMKMADVCDARIVLGGQLHGYAGLFPGVVEEAWLTLQAEKPLVAVGGFGGAAGQIAHRLLGEAVPELEEELRNPGAEVLTRRHRVAIEPCAPPSTQVTADGILDALAAPVVPWNRLDREENIRLAISMALAEVVDLVLDAIGTTRG